MDIHDRIKAVFPHAPDAEIERWIAGGREYAERLKKLPGQERESVCQLFACHGLTQESRYKFAYRRGIDAVIRAWYPKAGVDHGNA